MEDNNPTIVDQIMAMPSWYMNSLLYPFLPKNHHWKKHKRTPPLVIWTKWRSPTVAIFDSLIWGCCIALTISLVNMWFTSIVGT